MEKVLKKLRKKISSIEKQVFYLNVEINKTRAKLAFEKLLDLPSFKGEAKLYIQQYYEEGYDEIFYIVLNEKLSNKDAEKYIKVLLDMSDIRIRCEDAEDVKKHWSFKEWELLTIIIR